MGVRSRSKRKRKRKPKRKRQRRASARGAPADLISGLCDDVLVHILELLPDAGDAVRTGALSRRWRGLWTRLGSLTFASTSRPGVFSPDKQGVLRFASFVNSAIAVRAAAQQTDDNNPAAAAAVQVQHLHISFETPHELLPRSVGSKAAAPRWLRDACVHLDVRSFTLELHHGAGDDNNNRYYRKSNSWGQYAAMILGGLPSCRPVRTEAMRLSLGGATVWLPAVASFASLAELTLESMEFAAGSGHLLTRLVSRSSSPRLRKLCLREVSFATSMRSRMLEEDEDDPELLIEADELLELSWEEVNGLDILTLRTPRLRLLRTSYGGLDQLKISAPRLEELLFLDASQPYKIDIINGELRCVRCLRVKLTSHGCGYGGYYSQRNRITFRLPQCCTAVACLDLDLFVFEEGKRYVKNIIKGQIPQLPQVTSLTVHVSLYDLHSFGIGIADILPQCSNLKYLRICCTFRMVNDLDSPLLCNHQDSWKSHVVYSLPHLEEVEFMGLAGTECELWFLESMFTSITQLHKVAISFDPRKSNIKNRKHAFDFLSAFHHRIPPLQEYGIWTCCHESYLSLEWKPSLGV